MQNEYKYIGYVNPNFDMGCGVAIYILMSDQKTNPVFFSFRPILSDHKTH